MGGKKKVQNLPGIIGVPGKFFPLIAVTLWLNRGRKCSSAWTPQIPSVYQEICSTASSHPCFSVLSVGLSPHQEPDRLSSIHLCSSHFWEMGRNERNPLPSGGGWEQLILGYSSATPEIVLKAWQSYISAYSQGNSRSILFLCYTIHGNSVVQRYTVLEI